MLRALALAATLASALRPAHRPARRLAPLREYTLDDVPIASPLAPCANYILVKVDEALDSTKGGVFLTGQAVEKPSAGVVVAAGPGAAHPDTGVVMPMPVAGDDKVLYGKFDGSAIKYCGVDHQLIRDDDVLLSWRDDMTLDSVNCISDRVLIAVAKAEEATASGIALAAGVNEQTKTSAGKVVKVGGGRLAADGTPMPMPVAVGESVKFRDYAGSEVKLEGADYIVCRASDCLAKW
eukprot:CAMPEP_0119272912 /NCGR_PEP_ID=MMETSP1329-20130426/9147_1 /TAXON_ID=114041 /ORGANISM="Genus nov. species nov., Strain RCC1024" /LENGTH=236 /DNA_ID=CAMNT_0007273029 /DNA_START=157 /DNA_END=864 /DNA_ORIENTATION=-